LASADPAEGRQDRRCENVMDQPQALINREMPAPFDSRELRNALGHFATGVAVITARGIDGAAVGMTMSSFNSVSLDPPLVLFSVARSASSLQAMQDARGYGVNVLARDQQDLADRFARARSDKWTAIDHTLGHGDSPLLDGVLARFECAPHARHDGGDHVIFLARVMRFTSDPDAAPLIFYRGAYHGLAGHEPMRIATPMEDVSS